MSKFTQGKWVANDDGSIENTDSTGKILHYYLNLRGTGTYEDLVNARLIAAAPEMYELLQEVASTAVPGHYVCIFGS